MHRPVNAVQKRWPKLLLAAGGMALILLLGGVQWHCPARAETSTASVTGDEYVLDVGDEIRIDDAVVGNLASLDPNNDMGATDSVHINEDGLVDLPLVGQLQLRGMTISEAQRRLNQQFSRLLQNPKISIRVLTQHPVRVYVQGEVNRPGIYISGKSTQPDNKDHATLGGSSATEVFSRYYLTDALIQAGGLKVNANYQDIRIYRGATANPQVLHVNLWQLFQQGNSAGDVPLEERDRVEVPPLPAGQLAVSDDWKNISRTNIGVQLFQINIIGAVKQPGSYPVSTRENILSAIALAGGFAPDANTGGVYLLRANEHGQVFKKRLDASDKHLMSKRRENWPTLLPGDVIFVDDSVGKQALAIGKTLVDRTAGASILPFFSSLAAGAK